MKNKIYYLTRSYAPYQKGGGPLMRTGAVKYLKELGWDEIPFKKRYIQKLTSILERVGIYEDYLDKWVENSFEYLKNKINKEDIVFATSGGELGMIKLGSLLKDKIDCSFIVNFRDPLDYSLVHNLKLNQKFHVSREKQEQKYLRNSDLIITSSESNKISLENKYPKWKNRIKNNYFGYIKQINLNSYSKILSDRLRVAYVGNMGNLQSPEILYEIYTKLNNKNIEIYFVGNIESNEKLQEIKKINNPNIFFIDFLPHDNFLEFIIENIDIGFVSLTDDYLGACVPSKIYEYINLELPILGALPDGDGRDIINSREYGKACRYDDIEGLSNAMKSLLNRDYLESIKLNIIKDKESWSMKNRIKEVDIWLREELLNEN